MGWGGHSMTIVPLLRNSPQLEEGRLWVCECAWEREPRRGREIVQGSEEIYGYVIIF